jgi:protein-tyrosine-phosphatase
VTLARRVAAIEASLTPTQLVLRWLDEAHAFGDLESYVRSQLAEPSLEGPLDRLAREAASGASAGLRGKRPEIVDAAIRTALRETVFRFDLVMRILVTTHDLLEREGLIEAALSTHVALLTSEGRAERRRDPTYPERFVTLRGLLLFRLAELRAAQQAREAVEARYLAGHTALFPDAMAAWDAQMRSTETIADLACRLAELDGVPTAEVPDPDAASTRITELVADLVEPAKTTALEKLGEGEQAQRIATNWLRPKLQIGATSPFRT